MMFEILVCVIKKAKGLLARVKRKSRKCLFKSSGDKSGAQSLLKYSIPVQ